MHQAWMHLYSGSLGPAFAAFVLTLLTLYVIIPLAEQFGLVDRPGGRKTHAAPTPAVGGAAILLGSLPFALTTFQLTPDLLALAVAAVIVVGAGVWDDIRELRWYVRLCAQCAAGLALVYVGGVRVETIGSLFGASPVDLGVLSAPFTVLATVGVMNAVNMADGVDGLAGSLAAVALTMLTAAAIYSGNDRLGHGLLLLLSALLAFLALNLRTPWRPKARVFLGNAGSEFLGLVIAWAAFRLTQNADHPVPAALAPFFIALPVMDCLVLMVRRLRTGASPFAADRTHMHHYLMDAGWSATGTVILMCATSVMIGLAAAFALQAGAPALWLVIVFLVLTVAYYIVSARRDRCLRLFRGLRRLGRQAVVTPSLAPAYKADFYESAAPRA